MKQCLSDFTYTCLRNTQKNPVWMKPLLCTFLQNIQLRLMQHLPQREPQCLQEWIFHSGILKNITQYSSPASTDTNPVKLQNSLKPWSLKGSTLYCFRYTPNVGFKHYLYDAQAVYTNHLRLWSWMTKLFSFTANSKNKHGNTFTEQD